MSASKKDPAFLFYSKDWQDGTRAFFPAEKGIYIDLLAYQHQHGYVPADISRLAIICGIGVDEFKNLWETVKEKFVPINDRTVDRLVNVRLMGEMGMRKENAHKNAIIGVFATLCRKSNASKSAIYKIKQEFKVDNYTEFSKEIATERLTEWFRERLPLLENANANEDLDNVDNTDKEGEKIEPQIKSVYGSMPGPKVPQRENVQMKFTQSGGTLEMANAFFDKYDALGWYKNGAAIVNWAALVPSFIQNWKEIEAKKPKKDHGRLTVEEMRQIQQQRKNAI